MWKRHFKPAGYVACCLRDFTEKGENSGLRDTDSLRVRIPKLMAACGC